MISFSGLRRQIQGENKFKQVETNNSNSPATDTIAVIYDPTP